MLTLTRKELESKKKLELLEEFDPKILQSAKQLLDNDIQKGIITPEELADFWPIEAKSFKPVMVVEDDLSKNLRLIRQQQVRWDETTIQKSIGEREGVYMDTLRNREHGIVGMPWGYDIIKGKRAEIGEIRYYGGIPYRKVSATGNANKDWQVVKDMAKKPGAKGGEKHEEAKSEKEIQSEQPSGYNYKESKTDKRKDEEFSDAEKHFLAGGKGSDYKKKELTIKSTEQEVYDYFEALKGKKVSIGSGSYLRSGSISNVEILNGDKISNTGVFVNFLEDGDDSPEKIKVNFSDKDKFTVKSEKKEEPATMSKLASDLYEAKIKKFAEERGVSLKEAKEIVDMQDERASDVENLKKDKPTKNIKVTKERVSKPNPTYFTDKFYVDGVLVATYEKSSDYYHTIKNGVPSNLRDKHGVTNEVRWDRDGLKKVLGEKFPETSWKETLFGNSEGGPDLKWGYKGPVLNQKDVQSYISEYLK